MTTFKMMRVPGLRWATVALAAALLSAPAMSPAAARDGASPRDCALDHCDDPASTPKVDAGPTTPTAPLPSSVASGSFDFYVLALSWSPGFCDRVEGGHDQCEPGKGLGFVVHGLWPQHERGYPADCPGPRSPSNVALERAEGLYPDMRLARYEWRKHGTCTGRSPSDYFADVARARAAVTIPAPFVGARRDQTFAPIDIERAFYEANPRLRPGMMAVGCRRGVLEEVRLCLTKDLRDYRACPEVVRRGCRSREISVPAPL